MPELLLALLLILRICQYLQLLEPPLEIRFFMLDPKNGARMKTEEALQALLKLRGAISGYAKLLRYLYDENK